MTARRYGHVADVLDGSELYAAPPPGSPLFPASFIELREFRGSLTDQGQEGSCVAHAALGVEQSYVRRYEPDKTEALSRAALYALGRMREGTFPADGGMQIKTAVDIMQTQGVGRESLFPYDVSMVGVQPPQAVVDDGKAYRFMAPRLVPVTEAGVKSAILSGHPVMLGIPVYERFDATGPDGLIYLPEPGEALLGWHGVRLDAWENGYYDLPNSYGAWWGNNGVGKLPEAYLPLARNAWLLDIFGSGQ